MLRGGGLLLNAFHSFVTRLGLDEKRSAPVCNKQMTL
jgi:hypothetical protein